MTHYLLRYLKRVDLHGGGREIISPNWHFYFATCFKKRLSHQSYQTEQTAALDGDFFLTLMMGLV